MDDNTKKADGMVWMGYQQKYGPCETSSILISKRFMVLIIWIGLEN